MTRTSVRIALCLSLLSWSFAGCSGSDDQSLNTNNIGRADAATVVVGEEDAGDEDSGEGADAGGEGEGEGNGDEDAQVADAGDFDAIVSVEVADAGPVVDTAVVVETRLCGNGTIDGEEQCDQGADNSDTKPGACRSNCRRARCGDGVVDEGEACDQGASNSDSEANACRSDCRAHRCGDSVVDEGEQCDTGDARSDSAAGACRLTCRSARCGDGVRDTDEGCDDGNTVDTDACRNNCRSARCGDGVIDPDEECDDGNTVNTDSCRDTCRRPICGDRVVDPGEQCDDGNQVNNDGCRSNCRSGCVNDAGCSDGLFCTGTERCVDGLCNPGVGVNPDDNIGCTADVCREDLDRVVHTPNDALCTPPAPTCSGARGTTSTATCDAARGCVVRSTSTACADEPSACEMRGDGSFTLATFVPACEDSMSCGDATASTRVCAHVPASCNNRVFTGRADATCNPNTEACGNRAPATDDCRTRDSASCSAGNRTFTRVTGTCSAAGGCGSTTTGPTTCPDPADSCANATRTTYEPSCNTASGCGTPVATNTACTQASGPSCGSTGPNGQAALTTYAPACDPSGNGQCSTTGVAQGAPQVCTPRVASTCDNTSTRIPQETTYSPACNDGTSCSATGTATTRNCTASSTRTCSNAQVTSFAPDCNGARCRDGGRQITTACGASTAVACLYINDRANRVHFEPACDDANPGSCLANGQQVNELCTSLPITCSGNSEVRSVGQCSNGQCATSTTQCATGRSFACNAASTGVELREGTGACAPGTGCGYIVRQTSNCPSSCGTNPTTGALEVCPGGCAINANGQAACRACTPCNGRCLAGSCQAIIIGTPGGIGTVGSVAPGALSFQ